MTSVPPGGRTAPPYAIGAVVGAAGALLLAHPFGWTPSVAATALALAGLWYYSRGAEGQTRAASVATSTDWHLATIEALACAIDAKYHPAQPHTRRVQVYAAGLARAAGLGPDELQGVRTAALLHDIGELAVPEHILSKSGPLTREEFQKIRIHPRVSAEIIASVRFPYPVAPLILSHHERWDGTGYPQRLTGAQIPLGARILTVVDYFDALTTERPYRRAFEWNRAIQLLQEEAGKALDPVLVGTFVDILPALVAEYEAAARRDREPTPGRRRGSGDAFKHIALANREIHVLYEIAQTMGTSLGIADTMALISSKLSKIIPWSGCALFLYDAATDQLRCRFADGLDAPRLVGLTVAAGLHTAGGDVPRGRTILNGDPRATFTASGVSA
ncbi:MAG: HD domain-containing phosphohydrolase, partial [Acidobacteriota bacterium]